MSDHDGLFDTIRWQSLAFLDEIERLDDYDARIVRPQRTYVRRRWVIVVEQYLNAYYEQTFRLAYCELQSWTSARRTFVNLCQ